MEEITEEKLRTMKDTNLRSFGLLARELLSNNNTNPKIKDYVNKLLDEESPTFFLHLEMVEIMRRKVDGLDLTDGCQYIMTRGPRYGRTCSKPKINDRYCERCSKKKFKELRLMPYCIV